jgi:hypothetical protein
MKDKIQQALDALKANHQWHKDYDYYDGYIASDLASENSLAITCLEKLLAEIESDEPVGIVEPMHGFGRLVTIGELVGKPLYLHSQPAVPEGWKLVPIEPTDEMLSAAENGNRAYTMRNFGDIQTVQQGPYDHWADMIAAVPEYMEKTE